MNYRDTNSMIDMSYDEYARIRDMCIDQHQWGDLESAAKFEHHLGLQHDNDANNRRSEYLRFRIINHRVFQIAVLKHSIQYEHQ